MSNITVYRGKIKWNVNPEHAKITMGLQYRKKILGISVRYSIKNVKYIYIYNINNKTDKNHKL